MSKKPTPQEASESLTGFDEIAIKQKFGSPLKQLGDEDPTQFLRALVFVLRRRDGKADAEAFHLAQSMTLADVSAEFTNPTVEEQAEADFVEPPRTTKP